MTDKITIPQKHIDFCKAVAKLATEAGYRKVGISFTPGFYDAWDEPLQMHWEAGRHGADVQKVVVSSTVTVRTEAV